jgi:glutathione peroxidase
MKKLLLLIILFSVALFLIKKKEMTYRQSVLKLIYPLIMLRGKLFGDAKAIQKNTNNIIPKESIYVISIQLNDGSIISMDQFRGKKILLVNTASDCGFTGQYEELEKLHQRYSNRLIVIGFPANDFKEQEQKDDAAIAKFCAINYGVTFLLAKKTHVVKGEQQNELFNWLSHKEKNGWCNQQPVWNFSKYLVNETGTLTHFFANTVSPLDTKMIEVIN